MKKLLFLLLATIIVASGCHQNGKSTEGKLKALDSSSVVFKSLNGIDAVKAGKMVQNLTDMAPQDTTPLIHSFWISKNMLHDIVLLLDTELQKQKASGDTSVTDGIRIYFASDPSVPPPHLKTSIILVSTKYNGRITTADSANYPSRNRHRDYYDHSGSSALFTNLTSYESDCNTGANCSGARLYNCPTCTDDTNCPVSPHDMPISKAIKMVKGFGHHFINTTAEWFDLSLLEAIDKENRHNGIRIYYATYPVSNTYKSNRDCFVITTTENINGVNSDYYDCGLSQSYIDFYKKRHDNIPPKDDGELCPNNCD